MGSRARSERTPRARCLRLVAPLVLLAGLAGCHVGELLSSPGTPDDGSAPGVPLPVGARALLMVSGNDQRDTIGATLATPYVVRVSDNETRPVAGVTVRWEVVEGDGSVSVSQSVTDAGGVARATHTLGTSLGAHAVQASVAGIPGAPRFLATALHGAPKELAYEVDPSDAVMGERIDPAIRLVLRDRLGNVAGETEGSAGISIVSGTGTPLAQLSGTLIVPVDDGRLLFDDVRVSLVGVGYRVRVSVVGLAANSASFDVALIGNP
jgi:hypothetical protein